MSPLHRQPEWQQPADRHTRLSDPVLTVRQLSRFDLSVRHAVRIEHALVFATPKGGYEDYQPPRRPTRSEVAAKRYTAVYEVDMGVHPFSEALTLPSDNDAFEFTAEVDVSWQVCDPARFVASGHRDVPGLLLGELQRAARPETRRFTVVDSATAEREVLRAVTGLGPLGAAAGLQATWTLRLRRDRAGIDHQQRLQAIDHSAAEQVRVAQQGMLVDGEVDRRYQQQDALQIARAAEYGRQQQELILQQQRWEHEQAMLASGQQHELALRQGHQMVEMQQIEEQKIAFYQWHLQQGGVQAWALHLAQHPDDSRLVMNSMREDQLRLIQAQMNLVKELLGSEGAERFELEGPKQLALRTVSDILNQRLPGIPQNPPLLPAPAGTAPGGALEDHPAPAEGDAEAPVPPPRTTLDQPPAATAPTAPGSSGRTAAPPPAATGSAEHTVAAWSTAAAPAPHSTAPPTAAASAPDSATTPPAATPTGFPPPAPPRPPYVPGAVPAPSAAAWPPVPGRPAGAYPPPPGTAPAWQPPPGYGSLPTAPVPPATAPPVPSPPTEAEEDNRGGAAP